VQDRPQWRCCSSATGSRTTTGCGGCTSSDGPARGRCGSRSSAGGAWDTAAAIFAAQTVGEVDRLLLAPESREDEEFHRTVSEFLEEWSVRRGGVAFEAVRIIGEQWSERSSHLRDTLSRNHIPDRLLRGGLAHRAGAAVGARPHRPAAARGRPALPARRAVLLDPSDLDVAEAFGLMTPLPADAVYDTVVLARDRGLGARCTPRPRGCRRSSSSGGRRRAGRHQLRSIRNYLGFPAGISGSRLAFSAYQQAWAFGTTFHFMRAAQRLTTEPDGTHLVHLSDGATVRTRTVVLAAGASWRRLGVPEVEAFAGRGVFYGAPVSEAPAMRGRQVFLVGGGNSAGQAAVHLARYADGSPSSCGARRSWRP
jgi:thioredoxin reductase (NADPH)